jgi:hypothetical protein
LCWMEADMEAALDSLIRSSLAPSLVAFKAASLACFTFWEAVSDDSFFKPFLHSGLDGCFSSSSVTFATPKENAFVAVALCWFVLKDLRQLRYLSVRFVSRDIITKAHAISQNNYSHSSIMIFFPFCSIK